MPRRSMCPAATTDSPWYLPVPGIGHRAQSQGGRLPPAVGPAQVPGPPASHGGCHPTGAAFPPGASVVCGTGVAVVGVAEGQRVLPAPESTLLWDGTASVPPAPPVTQLVVSGLGSGGPVPWLPPSDMPPGVATPG